MIEIIVATTNAHKLREIGQVIKKKDTRNKIQIIGTPIKVKENGKTFEANAIKKVEATKLKTNQIAIADDSGLCVECLGGKPGIKSARFANPSTSDNLCRKLLGVMRGCYANRRASFICVMAVKYPSGKIKIGCIC